jgi:hypothetical protein
MAHKRRLCQRHIQKRRLAVEYHPQCKNEMASKRRRVEEPGDPYLLRSRQILRPQTAPDRFPSGVDSVVGCVSITLVRDPNAWPNVFVYGVDPTLQEPELPFSKYDLHFLDFIRKMGGIAYAHYVFWPRLPNEGALIVITMPRSPIDVAAPEDRFPWSSHHTDNQLTDHFSSILTLCPVADRPRLPSANEVDEFFVQGITLMSDEQMGDYAARLFAREVDSWSGVAGVDQQLESSHVGVAVTGMGLADRIRDRLRARDVEGVYTITCGVTLAVQLAARLVCWIHRNQDFHQHVVIRPEVVPFLVTILTNAPSWVSNFPSDSAPRARTCVSDIPWIDLKDCKRHTPTLLELVAKDMSRKGIPWRTRYHFDLEDWDHVMYPME